MRRAAYKLRRHGLRSPMKVLAVLFTKTPIGPMAFLLPGPTLLDRLARCSSHRAPRDAHSV